MNLEEWIQFTNENILTKKEAQDLLGMSDRAMNQCLATRRLVPVFESGEGRSMVRLYHRKHVEEYKVSVEERRMRLKNDKTNL